MKKEKKSQLKYVNRMNNEFKSYLYATKLH